MEKLSESMKQSILAAKQRISAMQSEIGQLMAKDRQPDGKRQERAERIAVLQRQIASTQERINDLKRRLPMQEMAEKAAEQMDREFAEKDRQQAAADRAAHDQAVRAAALVEWLKVPGQTQAGFESAWSGIANQIATQRAVTAGADESQALHLTPMRQAAADALAAKYGKGVKA